MNFNLNSKKRDKISFKLLCLAAKISKMKHKARNYGTDTALHKAEIHMIKAIKESGDIHVTGLADQLWISKGAVSQVIAKLDKKEMIVKDRDRSNQSRLVLSLTPKGETAYYYHEKLHSEFDKLVIDILSNTPEKEKEFLAQFLSTLERKMDDFEGGCAKKNGK